MSNNQESLKSSPKVDSYPDLTASMHLVPTASLGGEFGVSSGSSRIGCEFGEKVSDFEYFSRGDLRVSSLGEAQAIEDLAERVEQVTAWLHFHPESEVSTEGYEWRGKFESEDLGKYLPIESFEQSSELRYLFLNDCGLYAYSIPCECCGSVNTVPYYRGGDSHKRICPACSAKEARGRARRAMHLIYGFPWRHLGFLELTTPADWVDSTRFGDTEYVDEKQEALIASARKFMDRVFPGQPYVLSFHHWHSENPLSEPHFHVHITFGWIQCQRVESGRQTIKFLDPFIPLDFNAFVQESAHKLRFVLEWDNHERRHRAHPLTLESMRKIWATCLGIPESQSNLHYQFVSRGRTVDEQIASKERVLHRLKYSFRGYIEDCNRWFLDLEKAHESFENENWLWLAWHLRLINYEQVEPTIDSEGLVHVDDFLEVGDWPRRTRWCGAWSNSQVNEWVQYGSRAHPERILRQYQQEVIEDSKLYCHDCHHELEVEDWSSLEVVTADSAASALRRIIDRPPPSPSLRWGLVEVIQ